MITSVEEYNKYKYLLDVNKPPIEGVVLPFDETIYEIDLNTRLIQAPEYLSVATDHYAETVYFKCNRYFDNMDLTNTICIIQYKNENAKNEFNQPDGGHVYIVPFYDVTYLSGVDEGRILIPWCISGPATAAAGPITFAVEFFLLSEDKKEIIYKLNTQPAYSKILHGLNVTDGDNFVLMSTEYEQLLAEIQNIRGIKETTIYWYEP